MYLDAIKHLFEIANSNIDISMFLIAPGSKAVFNILELLKQSIERGISARVILSHYKNDFLLNKEAFSLLKKFKIPCRNYPYNHKMHRRCILIDDEHIVIGSHNLSANAFYNSIDLSIYIQSVKVAQQEKKYFESIWAASHPDKEKRLINFDLLSTLEVTEKEALHNAGIYNSKLLLELNQNSNIDNIPNPRLKQLKTLLSLMLELEVAEETAISLADSGVRSAKDLNALSNKKLKEKIKALKLQDGIHVLSPLNLQNKFHNHVN